MTSTDRDAIDALLAVGTPPGPPELAAAYGPMIESLRGFLDALTSADMSIDQADDLRERLDAWTAALRKRELSERDRLWGHWAGTDDRGQALIPKVYDQVIDGWEITGKVVFGQFYVGENAAVHGGALGLLFDDILGWLGMTVDPPLAPARTAYLKTDYRAVTPVGVELEFRARIDRVEGRKRFMVGELRHGDTVCAEIDGLWVELKPGQA